MLTTSISSGDSGPEKNPGEATSRARGSLPTPKMNRGVRSYLNELGREMRRVSWPTRAETNRLTGVVLGVCLFVGAVLSGLSYGFGIIIDLITRGRV